MAAGNTLKTSSSLLLRVAALPLDQEAWRQFAKRYGPCIIRWCAHGEHRTRMRKTSPRPCSRILP